ncbi:hypothetical protein, partial [Klebsiella pneumoniae]|uniref:hypothetical protein n=1 Tax=Klebsiella pneumoniae TaxID=573 RepID=UPI001952E980
HWPISLDGRETILDCQVLGQRYVSLVKQVLIIWLAKLDPTTVCLQLEQLASSVRAGGLGIFERMLVEPPATYRVSWIMEIAPSLKATQCYA